MIPRDAQTAVAGWARRALAAVVSGVLTAGPVAPALAQSAGGGGLEPAVGVDQIDLGALLATPGVTLVRQTDTEIEVTAPNALVRDLMTPGVLLAQTPDGEAVSDDVPDGPLPGIVDPESAAGALDDDADGAATAADVIDTDETAYRETVLAALARAQDAEGAFGAYDGLEPRDIALREAAMLALERNLDIKRSGLSRSLTRQAVVEAEAVFLPTFTLTYSLSRFAQDTRIERPNRFRRETEIDQITVPPVRTFGDPNVNASDLDGPPLDFIYFDLPREAFVGPSRVEASLKPDTPTTKTNSITGSISQLFPGGGSLGLAANLTHKPAIFSFRDEVNDRTIWGYYDRDWTSSVSASMSFPLPWTAGSGPDSAADVAVDVARLGRDGAEIDVQVVINRTLLQVDVGYWTLVQAMLELDNAEEVRALGDRLIERTERLYNEQQITEGALAQVEAQYAQIRQRQQDAWQAYVSASTALVGLLDLERTTLLVPTDYLAYLDRQDLPEAEAEEVLQNPEYLRTAVNLAVASRNRAAAQNQARTILSVDASINVNQSNAVFGYSDPWTAATEIADPDSYNWTLGASWIEPIGRESQHANVSRNTLEMERQNLLRERVESRLRTSFETARIGLSSARQRVEITRRGVELAADVYDRAQRFQTSRLTTEYEVVERLTELLTARNNHVQALVAAKQAEARYLASFGGLADRYGERTATSLFDRTRLRRLAQSGRLRFFAGGPS